MSHLQRHRTPLHNAAAENCPEICQLLIQAWAEVDAKDDVSIMYRDHSLPRPLPLPRPRPRPPHLTRGTYHEGVRLPHAV